MQLLISKVPNLKAQLAYIISVFFSLFKGNNGHLEKHVGL